MRRFFTADEHTDHANVIDFCERPFADLGIMVDELVYRHNHVVRPCDVTYHLGDVAFKMQGHLDYVRRLNGQHILIKGNHDRSRDVKRMARLGRPYAWIADTYMIKKPQKIWLSHYPHMSWPDMHHGSLHLHGHSHGMLSSARGKMLDVGVDCRDFAPVSEDDVTRILSEIAFAAVDGHGQRSGKPSLVWGDNPFEWPVHERDIYG